MNYLIYNKLPQSSDSYYSHGLSWILSPITMYFVNWIVHGCLLLFWKLIVVYCKIIQNSTVVQCNLAQLWSIFLLYCTQPFHKVYFLSYLSNNLLAPNLFAGLFRGEVREPLLLALANTISNWTIYWTWKNEHFDGEAISDFITGHHTSCLLIVVLYLFF